MSVKIAFLGINSTLLFCRCNCNAHIVSGIHKSHKSLKRFDPLNRAYLHNWIGACENLESVVSIMTSMLVGWINHLKSMVWNSCISDDVFDNPSSQSLVSHFFPVIYTYTCGILSRDLIINRCVNCNCSLAVLTDQVVWQIPKSKKKKKKKKKKNNKNLTLLGFNKCCRPSFGIYTK